MDTTATTAKTNPASIHRKRMPNESAAYRTARDKLLEAELALRRNVEAVAATRRALPDGGRVPQDYVFDEGAADLGETQTVRRTRMSELFLKPDRSLVVYGFMYGPKMARPCPSCTSILDALNATAPHATQRINLAVVAKSPIERIRGFARERSWRNLRLLSSADNGFQRDYHAEDDEGAQLPAVNVFARRGAEVHHMFCSELLFAPTDPGQDARHADMIWPLWNLFDFTPEGRGVDWHPALEYES
jgi:predicted dithiol-disulfide oxidoreductase (DUF899 family)